MNLKSIYLTLDPRTAARLTLLAEELRMTLPDLITDVLDQHLDDVCHLKAQADAGDGGTCAYAMQPDQSEKLGALQAWLRLSPQARWDAVERGLVQPPWAELEAAEAAAADDQAF